ncbi:MAG: DNA methyltransferase, partial [Lachnospiraceae bacterium]|nr:DNA methyltransferase [Lachnospiraceae bacterium]
MLDKVIANTNEYLEAIPKSERKKYGQFFTSKETAEYMSGMFKGARLKGKVRCLDPGAGSGILACALIRYLNGVDAVEEIDFTCYENDIRIIDLLKENVEICKKGSSKKVSFTVKAENYITSQYLEFND